ncbi:jasmonic acid-amido synthetase JAR1-like [Asparagus officinalis]|uniref:jasmonic acid-amido synthetase JAR1-like n=1 Tax=Asparagus officinalis TaxID=4686 RepID=UPI00098E620E|nr:jasmonic acid-amido synthetase JAR1-like [Asparagus officinalis]XP_020272204.1 jasmonic acid-amido synthetase JAR1-like [Asparagus officinalis]XP_020272210.1 jasmonic acid-amido synthetase JAR1-like [Asparagus officinalis]
MNSKSVELEIEEFETMTTNADIVQRETLQKILEQNGQAEYLQASGLRGRTDPESFKACIPLVTHEDLEPYLQRIVDGDDSPILTGRPVTALSLSSGTTHGKSKLIPFNEEMLRSTMQIYRTSFAFINREYPVNDGKALQFIYASKQSITKGGLIATTGTTNIYRSRQFKNTMQDIHSQCCSPDEVIFCVDYNQSVYCHLLCGLIYSQEVQIISSAFAFSIVHALRTFEQVWEEICADIREGILSNKITIPSLREAVSKILTPNRNLADTIYRKCMSLSNWCNMIPELWPNAKYVYGIMTGSMEPYARKLQRYAGSLPVLSAYYGASEGWIGANVNPRLKLESVAYAVFPNISYFEFLPRRENRNEQELDNVDSKFHRELDPVGLTEVEIGCLYEVIITNFAGLYRYKLGDIVKVVSFHNSTPELQFICRRNNLLSINIDKNTENDIQMAINEASRLLALHKLEIVDFTTHADSSSDPGHYVIFLELSSDASEDVLNSCSSCLDLAFVERAYVLSRRNNIVGPLELRVVCRGTFHKILEYYADIGTTMSQFKMPRCVGSSNDKLLKILCRNVVRSYFSTAYG